MNIIFLSLVPFCLPKYQFYVSIFIVYQLFNWVLGKKFRTPICEAKFHLLEQERIAGRTGAEENFDFGGALQAHSSPVNVGLLRKCILPFLCWRSHLPGIWASTGASRYSEHQMFWGVHAIDLTFCGDDDGTFLVCSVQRNSTEGGKEVQSQAGSHCSSASGKSSPSSVIPTGDDGNALELMLALSSLYSGFGVVSHQLSKGI